MASCYWKSDLSDNFYFLKEDAEQEDQKILSAKDQKSFNTYDYLVLAKLKRCRICDFCKHCYYAYGCERSCKFNKICDVDELYQNFSPKEFDKNDLL